MDWFDRAAEELDEQLENGEITDKEYRIEMAYLRAEYRDCAQEAAQDTYDSYY
jgi:uncharacterized membrane protein